MQILSIVFFLAALGGAYALLLRPVLRRRAQLAALWGRIDRIEATWWGRIKDNVRGLKTRLAARFVGLAGALVLLHDFLLPIVAGVDWTPLTASLPPYALPLILMTLAALFSYLRTVTDGPPADATVKE